MTYTSRDWSKAITKLTELTSKGTLKWSLTNSYAEDNWEVVDRAFASSLQSSKYVVKVVRRKNYVDEDEYYWEGGTKLEVYKEVVLGEGEKLISIAPVTPVIGRLQSAIEASFAFQSGALDGLLDD